MPKFVAFERPNGKTVYINPEHVAAVEDLQAEGEVAVYLAVTGSDAPFSIRVRGCAHDVLAEIGD